MSAQPETETAEAPSHDGLEKPLNEAVKTALHVYFEQLRGERPDGLYRLVIEEVERPLLECVIEHCNGNQTQAAQCLGLNRGTLRKKLKYYALD